jgi:hypothetical protein
MQCALEEHPGQDLISEESAVFRKDLAARGLVQKLRYWRRSADDGLALARSSYW